MAWRDFDRANGVGGLYEAHRASAGGPDANQRRVELFEELKQKVPAGSKK
jgi:hypothetical protein